jgi:hypothetical protein
MLGGRWYDGIHRTHRFLIKRAREMQSSVSVNVSFFALALLAACGASQKPFDQMTAQEHHAAAAREHELADRSFARAADRLDDPESVPMGAFYEVAGIVPYGDYAYEIDDPEAYTVWPRIEDPLEGDADSASKHRERALRHERAAALLEGRPSPMPLPPPQPPLIEQT